MKNYNSYMDRQEISPVAHEKMLNLEPEKKSVRPWITYGALAACAVLIVGMGVWKLALQSQTALGPGQSSGQFVADYDPLPGETDVVGPGDLFVVDSPLIYGESLMPPMIPAINYQDISDWLQADVSRVYAPGSFTVDLTKEEIQDIFWGLDGKPEAEQADLPWTLFWDGYTLHGYAWYDGQGQLMELTLWGKKGRAGFELELRLGTLPITCCIDLNRGDGLSEFNGVEIVGWSQAYDRDGDDITDYICGSEFMTQNDIGVRFKNWNNAWNNGGSLEREALFNTFFVRQALIEAGGLYLDHLKTAESVPAWREEEFSTLAQAREESDFAPYLPTSEPEGYSAYAGNKEFYGRLSYQEGTRNILFVRWSREYDNVEVCVYRDGTYPYHLTSPDEPETYDLRLYPIPWCDSVPEKYWETVNAPAFRAEDMSLAIVEARGREHDTGGMTYSFDVLHSDGTLVSYRCDGLTARQVWEMVEETM